MRQLHPFFLLKEIKSIGPRAGAAIGNNFRSLIHSVARMVKRGYVRCAVPCLLVFVILVIFYLICIRLDSIDFFFSVLSHYQRALMARAVAFGLFKLGFVGGLASAFVFLSKAFFTAEASYMLPSSSGPGSSEAAAPQEPFPAAPIDPDVYHPLLEDAIRREELSHRLRVNTIARGYSPQVQDSIVDKQFEIDKFMERALLSDGYSKDSILAKRHEIRGFVFYPTGVAFSEATYTNYLHSMANHGTHRSLPYQRLMEAVFKFDIFLDK